MKQLHYRSCIVRIWYEPDDGKTAPSVRFALEMPSTGALQGFTSFQALVASLWQQLVVEGEAAADPDSDDPEAPNEHH